MKKILLVFALLYSLSTFAASITFEVSTNGQCFCECTCDFDAGVCTFFGDCDGTHNCPSNIFCQSNGVCFRTGNIVLQSMQLVYNGIKRNEFDIARTGMIGTTEGTYPDYEKIYIIDGTTPLTNEIKIVSHWCTE